MSKDTLSLKESVYNSIIEDIINMEYAPGDIINEKQLIERYNCSKSPVRDALQVLCSENVIRVLPRYGYEVIRINMDEIHEMIRYREVLECGILKKNGDSITKDKIEKLSSINEKCQRDDSNIWTHWNHNVDFHVRLISFSGNNYCRMQLLQCMKRMRRAYAQLSWVRGDNVLSIDTRNHEKIIQALRDADIEMAIDYLKKDLDDFGVLGSR